MKWSTQNHTPKLYPLSEDMQSKPIIGFSARFLIPHVNSQFSQKFNIAPMNNALQIIQKKINAIQIGLLKFRSKENNVSLQVKAAAGNDCFFDCVTEEEVKGLHNKQVTLVQKHKDDYIYITGKVESVVKKNKTVISIVILKACWFVRASEGSLTWLEEKQVYERQPGVALRMAS